MPKIIDLHTHTTCSDGSLSPRELVQRAKTMGLAALAITDHDTVKGIEEAMDEGNQLGIEVIAGIEISVDFKPEMHLLGYFFNNTYQSIQKTLDELKIAREKRNVKIVDKLNQLGFALTVDEIKAEAWGGIVGRPHIARALVNKGYVKNTEEAFDKYLCSGGVAYFKREELSPEDGIREILQAGGVPVLAHPIYLSRDYHQLDTLLSELTALGLKGMEAIYVDNTKEDTGNLLRLAIKHNLLVTGGSDYHGDFKSQIELGVGRGNLVIPYELLEKLRMA